MNEEIKVIKAVLMPLFEAWTNPENIINDFEIEAARTVEDMVDLAAHRIYVALFEETD